MSRKKSKREDSKVPPREIGASPEERHLTAVPIGEVFSTDGTRSLKGKNADVQHVAVGCYRRMPTCRD